MVSSATFLYALHHWSSTVTPLHSLFLPAPAPSPFSENFAKYAVTFEQFAKKPALLTHPDLVVKVKGQCYNWQVAAPLLMSILVFHRPLPQVGIIGQRVTHGAGLGACGGVCVMSVVLVLLASAVGKTVGYIIGVNVQACTHMHIHTHTQHIHTHSTHTHTHTQHFFFFFMPCPLRTLGRI